MEDSDRYVVGVNNDLCLIGRDDEKGEEDGEDTAGDNLTWWQAWKIMNNIIRLESLSMGLENTSKVQIIN